MNTRKQTFQQYLILSLLVVYQVVSLLHLAQLQRVGTDAAGNKYHFVLIDLIHKNHPSGNTKGKYQHGITSGTEYNRKVLTVQAKSFLPFFSFVLAGLALLPIAKRVSAHVISFKATPACPYLLLRTLRI